MWMGGADSWSGRGPATTPRVATSPPTSPPKLTLERALILPAGSKDARIVYQHVHVPELQADLGSQGGWRNVGVGWEVPMVARLPSGGVGPRIPEDPRARIIKR